MKLSTLNIEKVNFLQPLHHVFHTGEGMTHGPSHLKFWMDYFSLVASNTLILLRNQDLYLWAKEEYPNFSIAYAKNVPEIDTLFSKLPFVRNIYYSSNTGNVLHTLKFNEVKHIFLGHGDSDKSASAHKFFRVYDEVWVAGQAHIDRFKNAGFDVDKMSFVKVGRPSLRDALNTALTPWDKRGLNSVLYLPTWEGVYEESDYSSVRLSYDIFTVISKVLPEYQMYTKFHPVTGSRDNTLLNHDQKIKDKLAESSIELNINSREVSVDSLIKKSNIFICDISAVVSECLATDAPIFIYIPKDKDIIIAKSNMAYTDYCYVFSTVEEFENLLYEVAVKKNDYLSDIRKQAINYIISPDETISCRFEKILFDISTQAKTEPNVVLPIRQ
jgi:hypothetical protein